MRPLEDTIAAIGTPPGEGGIAVVRVSGPRAKAAAQTLLRQHSGEPVALGSRGVHLCRVVAPQSLEGIDEALVLWMPGPSSYTREDVLEIQCHGGHTAARGVLQAALTAGARLAEPGEFTLRAFMNGRLDLLQAEAVLDVIRARSEEALRAHQRLLEGRLSREVAGWQEALGRALIPVEAQLDFPEEDVVPADLAVTLQAIEGVIASMEEKLATSAWGRAAREGFRVALVGSPNTGKSSLLNRLLEDDRAIVSQTPGTTRDVIEVWADACGVPVRFADTAGLRLTEDELEGEGVRRARRAAADSDLILWICDGSRLLTPEEREEACALARLGRVRPVVNKIDLGSVPDGDLRAVLGQEPLRVSALTGEGVATLLRSVRDAAWQGDGPSAEAPLTRERHRRGVAQALDCLRSAREILSTDGYPEVAASAVHAARSHLAALLGWGTPEDVLEGIFSEFCIGK